MKLSGIFPSSSANSIVVIILFEPSFFSILFIRRPTSTPEGLRASIEEIRRQGWVIIDQELEIGLRSLAVPVRDAAGQVLAALNVGTHVSRVSRHELETRFLPALLEASRELSSRLFA